LQPFADDTCALRAIARPGFRENVVDDIVGLDAERVLEILAAGSPSSQSIACSRRLVMRLTQHYKLLHMKGRFPNDRSRGTPALGHVSLAVLGANGAKSVPVSRKTTEPEATTFRPCGRKTTFSARGAAEFLT
jgi:hypothetical protein